MTHRLKGSRAVITVLLVLGAGLLLRTFSQAKTVADKAAAMQAEFAQERAYTRIEDARAALQKNPNDTWAHLRLSGYHIDRKEWPAAIQEARAALAADPHNGHAAFRLGLVLRRNGQRDEATRVIQKLAQTPGPAAWNETAQELLDKWKRADAA